MGRSGCCGVEVGIGDERVSPEAVFPDWSLLDRFGIVVTEPLGGSALSQHLQRGDAPASVA